MFGIAFVGIPKGARMESTLNRGNELQQPRRIRSERGDLEGASRCWKRCEQYFTDNCSVLVSSNSQHKFVRKVSTKEERSVQRQRLKLHPRDGMIHGHRPSPDMVRIEERMRLSFSKDSRKMATQGNLFLLRRRRKSSGNDTLLSRRFITTQLLLLVDPP